MSNGNSRRDLSLWGISDTELLHVIDDLADEDGWVNSYDVRHQLGEHPDEPDPHSGVPTRLAWLKRYGWLERSLETGLYRLTAVGSVIIERPGLSKTVERALEGLSPAQRLTLTRELAENGATAREEIRTALRREWQRNLGRRPGGPK